MTWGKRGEDRNTKTWISWERKGLYRWNKNFFIVFEGLSLGEKLKIWWKIVDTSFKQYMAQDKD